MQRSLRHPKGLLKVGIQKNRLSLENLSQIVHNESQVTQSIVCAKLLEVREHFES